MNNKKAIILLSGGLDSTTTLAIAKNMDFSCLALSFNYGQKNISEISASKKICKNMKIDKPVILNIDLGKLGNSALTDDKIKIENYNQDNGFIPSTYVPARNTIFLSFALAYAEVCDVQDIFIGINSVDYSGYPDCREEYIQQFTKMANLATKQSIEGKKIKIHSPLLHLNKKQIIQKGLGLKVDYSLTVSCYAADKNGKACGVCDSCHYRTQGFLSAEIKDPTLYHHNQ
ncbi:MAG: 7-cyano-7-deazaguanine synthase QueC [Gammaproteobacteria bacterium]|nr:MAG: 7-cyano-7-deazaguanine synthase QueC [Gammaproteobacteria bacterium]